MTTFDIDSKDPSTITATPSPPDTRKLNDGKDTAPSLENDNIENGEFQHGSVDEAGLLDLLSKPQIVIMWVGLLLMSTINYLNVSVLFTLSVYALSDFNHAAAEGTLGTIFGVVAIGKMRIPHSAIVCWSLMTVNSHPGSFVLIRQTIPVSIHSSSFLTP